MNRLKFAFKHLVLATLISATFVACEEDEAVVSGSAKGEVQMEITDAPIDDADVQAVFVTVAEVRIDGETFSGFSGKKTIDLMALQNGKVEALGLGKVEVGTYSDLSLVLDYETDANGNQPGCYVLTDDNTKANLAASSNSTQEIKINQGDFEVKEDDRTNVVVDFDLRKAIRYEENSNDENEFEFVTENELKTAIRFVDREDTGHVEGNCDDSMTNSDRIVVYAYKKGEFNQESEIKGQGSSEVEFKNAVTSTVVTANGDYQLSFLESGEYELVFVAYEENPSNGKSEIKGILELNSLLGLNLGGLTVEAGVNVSLNVVVTGIIPL